MVQLIMSFDSFQKKPKTFSLFLSPEQMDIVSQALDTDKSPNHCCTVADANRREGLKANIRAKLKNIMAAARRTKAAAEKLARGEFDFKSNKGARNGSSL